MCLVGWERWGEFKKTNTTGENAEKQKQQQVY